MADDGEISPTRARSKAIAVEETVFGSMVSNSVLGTVEVVEETPNYYDWRTIYPDLQILHENISLLQEEIGLISQWTPWPEDHYSAGSDWTVFPFLHTFPAIDASKSTWIQSTNSHCPGTSRLLHTIPNIRTALFSRLGPGTKLSSHTGWADLANYVLRCHICVQIPGDECCGLIVNGETSFHKQGEILVFDDSKRHKAFNDSGSDRIVLIVDIMRPPGLPLGRAKGQHTDELDSFVAQFH